MSRKPDVLSIETRRRTRPHGTALVSYRVRCTGPDGSRERRTFDDLDSAVAFRDELDRRAALIADGPAARATMIVGDCYEQWMRDYVRPQLAAGTIRNYEGFWSRHLRERAGARRSQARHACAHANRAQSSAKARVSPRCAASTRSHVSREVVLDSVEDGV
jgi:hypothetical protein